MKLTEQGVELDKMTDQERIAELEAENAALRAARSSRGPGLSHKVTEKGGLSVYGLGRFPVSLYAGQWLKLAGYIPVIVEFIEANKDSLSWK